MSVCLPEHRLKSTHLDDAITKQSDTGTFLSQGSQTDTGRRVLGEMSSCYFLVVLGPRVVLDNLNTGPSWL